jgi:cytosine/adenosine deaminase-related metal-dependent hydrolase
MLWRSALRGLFASALAATGSIAASAAEIVCEAPSQLETGICAVTSGEGDARRISGTVLAPDTIYRGGEVVVDADGVIRHVGCAPACDADPACSAVAAGATTIACPEGVISPGLINSHDHITFTQNSPVVDSGQRYEHRHDWRLAGPGQIVVPGSATQNQIRWGELRFLLGGATSTAAAGSTAGLLRNLDTAANQEGLAQTPVDLDTFPLGDSNGPQLTASCAYPGIVTPAEIAGFDAYVPHVAEGIGASARNEFLCLGEQNPDHDVVRDESAFTHGIGLLASDLDAMAAAGTSLVWSPRSNLALYGDSAPVAAADTLGVSIALGSDWIATGSMNLLRELRCADDFNQTYLDGRFSDRELWLMVTRNAAIATATDDAIGVLAPGRVADLAIFDGRARSDHRAVIGADPQDVVLVLRGGDALYGDTSLLGALEEGAGCDALDECLADKSVCLIDEIAITLAELQTAVGSIYPAFFCDTPDDEPTCVPSRSVSVQGSSIYDGIPVAGDADGDGIADANDHCPQVFNPIRPLDAGVQADFDGDALGDACDPRPVPEPSAALVAAIAVAALRAIRSPAAARRRRRPSRRSRRPSGTSSGRSGSS